MRRAITDPLPDFKVIQVIRFLQIVRLLMSKADTKGMTHGEKHHLIEVSLMLIGESLQLCQDEGYIVLAHHNVPEVTAVDDIPF